MRRWGDRNSRQGIGVSTDMTGQLFSGAVILLAALSAPQVGRIWTYDDRFAEADLVVVADIIETRDTGRKARHPSLSPRLPVVELESDLRVLGVFKGELPGSTGSTATRIVLHHYRFDREQWLRENPPGPDGVPPGLANGGTQLQFDQSGPYLLFLIRTERGYEPVSGHTFPTESAFGLSASRPRSPRSGETYDAVETDGEGNLVVIATGGRRQTVRMMRGQAGFGTPVISPDRRAVVATALYDNCCTSYQLPRQLVAYADGITHWFGSDLAVFEWGFADEGRRVAYGTEQAHSSCSTHYVLRDIRSARVIDEADVPRSCGQIPNPDPVDVPGWVATLRRGGR